MEKTEESKTTQQNIDFVTSSEGYRPLQDLNLIDDYMFDIATMDRDCKSIIQQWADSSGSGVHKENQEGDVTTFREAWHPAGFLCQGYQWRSLM
ncbi:MAG: hypothetical protein V8S54_03010 [Lachnospiraceae bacterium]